jgi:hypothetical protein
MLRLLMIMHHNALLHPVHCMLYLVSHICTFVIDHTEQGHTEPTEPAPIEGADYEQDQGKP